MGVANMPSPHFRKQEHSKVCFTKDKLCTDSAKDLQYPPVVTTFIPAYKSTTAKMPTTTTLTLSPSSSFVHPHISGNMPFSLRRFGSKKPTTKDETSSISRGLANMSVGPERTTPTRRPKPQEAPPAYSAAPAPSRSIFQRSSQPAAAPASQTQSDGSPYAFLSQFDTVFLIDDSGSMAGSRWRETSDVLSAIAPICTQQDSDGIDILFLNHRRVNSNLGMYNNVTTCAEVREIFSITRPSRSTPTAQRLLELLRPYLAKVEQDVERTKQGLESTLKPLNVIVITDGEADDDVEAAIKMVAKKLDKLDALPWQVGIQFFQVGSDPEATEELNHLDDNLADKYDMRDIVDTTPWKKGDTGLTADGILKGILGAINKKLDRKRNSDEKLRQ